MPAPIYVTNEPSPQFVIGYEDGGNPAKRAALEAGWKKFNRLDPATGQTYKVWYRSTNRNKDIQVDHLLPPGALAGRYRIEVFIPGEHAKSRSAIYTVAHSFPLQETIAIVNQFDRYDSWWPLGDFDINPAAGPTCGQVRQFDLSYEDPAVDMAFGPVRWIPLFTLPGEQPRYDSPVGTQSEREGPFSTQPAVWVGNWFNANPFLNWYFLGNHTGADLNLSMSTSADRGAPVYAVADGLVRFAGSGSGKWGVIVVLEHSTGLVTLPGGKQERRKVYSRYAHLTAQLAVKKGQQVKRGDLIGYIGLAIDAVNNWHLHFDISHTDMLNRNPSHWPDLRKVQALEKAKKTNTKEYRDAQKLIMQEVVANYVDPLRFLKDNHGF